MPCLRRGSESIQAAMFSRPRVPRRLESTRQRRLRQGFARSSPLRALDAAISVLYENGGEELIRVADEIRPQSWQREIQQMVTRHYSNGAPKVQHWVHVRARPKCSGWSPTKSRTNLLPKQELSLLYGVGEVLHFLKLV